MILFILIIFCKSFTALDVKQVGGRIEDNVTGQPIPGVAIFVPELNRGEVSDPSGNFSFPNLPAQKLTFQFSLLGYKTHIVKMDPRGLTDPWVIQLEQTTTTMDEVVVSGAYVMSRENSPISIEKINRKELLKMPSPSLMSSLSKTPGINEVSLGPGI